jgi:hypothetical protein
MLRINKPGRKPYYKLHWNTRGNINGYSLSRLYKFVDKRGVIRLKKGFYVRRFLKQGSLKWVQGRRFFKRTFVMRNKNLYKYKKLRSSVRLYSNIKSKMVKFLYKSFKAFYGYVGNKH